MEKKRSKSMKSTFDKWMAGFQDTRKGTIIGIAFLLLFFVVVSVFVRRASQSDAMLMIYGFPTPIRAFAGTLSSIANLSLILMVVFYGKPGFIAAIALLFIQFPGVIAGILVQHNYTNISGVFTNIFAILVIILIYLNNEKIHTQAITDALTGMPNRFACLEIMNKLIRQKSCFALVTFNLNNFKSINSTMGMQTGNDVLIEIGSRLSGVAEKEISGTKDFVTCQGGDEFSLIVRDYKSEQQLLSTIDCYKQADLDDEVVDKLLQNSNEEQAQYEDWD